MRNYEYRHRVCLEETNVVGNVYYTNYVRWQGRCREMFLHDHVPELVHELGRGFSMATTRVSCSYYYELSAFDEVVVRMTGGAMTPSRLTMVFRYYRVLPDGQETLVAEGEQEVVCTERQGGGIQPIPLPASLRDAVAQCNEPTYSNAAVEQQTRAIEQFRTRQLNLK
jgi:enediyne biosynthesis thioesterase